MIREISKEALLVMVPEGAHTPDIRDNSLGYVMGIGFDYIDLPPGEWENKGLVPELPLEVLEKIMGKAHGDDLHELFGYICTSKGMPPNQTYLLTQKKQ